ncbi:MAG: hypothetical protein EA415_03300 [Sphaerobacteraceae bacterium]|nr:MAG: hypothetical protein EA415_03300 [Sphaerobacteraceae bacterium]
MTDRTKRVIIRAGAIGLQWIGLTIALGALVMRADASYSELITPSFGAAPVFFGAMIAGFLLGLTIESPRFLAPLVILMCMVASGFVGILTYAPVVDGILIRTPALDNYVSQRVILMTLIMIMAVIPSTVAGTLLGGNLRVRQEIAPHPEDLAVDDEVPWWEQRYGSHSGTESDAETGRRPI